MLYQFAGDGDRPTYFEMLAAEQLPASLKAALLYVLGVSGPGLVVGSLLLGCEGLHTLSFHTLSLLSCSRSLLFSSLVPSLLLEASSPLRLEESSTHSKRWPCAQLGLSFDRPSSAPLPCFRSPLPSPPLPSHLTLLPSPFPFFPLLRGLGERR